ncbi:hypothetical protein Bhyg_01471 [Pseudolycoriella hygida]|uniref:Uncharacterized protein n=1 Tax=Pseudolycoriella hygida TaxID=35572 RepID=A0A9Q0N9L5_9DIPT|nr:hypothetical protein Bhyg_01471 [Pseudolycoriella hygida]
MAKFSKKTVSVLLILSVDIIRTIKNAEALNPFNAYVIYVLSLMEVSRQGMACKFNKMSEKLLKGEA